MWVSVVWCVMCVDWIFMFVCVGCTGNKISDIGAQTIGHGLKSLTSLTTLILSGEWCCNVCIALLYICGDEEFADNPIGDIGAQCICDSLKSLTSLKTLYLSCEECVVWICRGCVWLNGLVSGLQVPTLAKLEHNALVIVSSHLHHWQHLFWVVSDAC